ncbi:thiol:disulfide interchange protein DsbA/DsbL [Pseudomaricurvus sp. HS19]|uniref:thiol:disulfide interchange protein DsbA/DsbL n=1 Tax=Pseudomaricurvus sp. HS19 TaxID=2692626 RepID=UPI00137174D8|nr:thiol:disulfide interchange protein DsbA/DsbL [Pseudomaricurvus sp. HS19]MYM63727.1 thioredoxin domain-containing protein [Pseudomaricurvus sp. HS19]
MRFVVALLTTMLALVACAEDKGSKPTYEAGTHYVVLNKPVHTLDPNKIEVTEVFWYGCGHCFQFEPLISAWKAKQKSDVVFRGSPAMWRPNMEEHARAFYTAQALGVLDKMHLPLFNALNLQGMKLDDEKSLEDFFASQGVDREAFKKAFNSFGVTSQVKQAEARARSYGITGTPEVVVDGKYRVSGRMAGNHEEMLKVVDYLVAKVRAEKG